MVAFAFGAYIAGAYWFTSATSFANPAIDLARMLTATFAGIAPGTVIPFLVVQLLGTLVAVGAIRVLDPKASPVIRRDGG